MCWVGERRATGSYGRAGLAAHLELADVVNRRLHHLLPLPVDLGHGLVVEARAGDLRTMAGARGCCEKHEIAEAGPPVCRIPPGPRMAERGGERGSGGTCEPVRGAPSRGEGGGGRGNGQSRPCSPSSSCAAPRGSPCPSLRRESARAARRSCAAHPPTAAARPQKAGAPRRPRCRAARCPGAGPS